MSKKRIKTSFSYLDIFWTHICVVHFTLLLYENQVTHTLGLNRVHLSQMKFNYYRYSIIGETVGFYYWAKNNLPKKIYQIEWLWNQ